MTYYTPLHCILSYLIASHLIASYRMTGQYLMAERPWTELYVSFCMKKYTPPSLQIMHAAVPSLSIDLSPKLESTYITLISYSYSTVL